MSIFDLLKNPLRIIPTLGLRNHLLFLSDEKYIKLTYKALMGKDLNLDSPSTYNEKIQWLKLNDRQPIYTKLVDKYLVKDWVISRIGEKYVVPTIAVWSDPSLISLDTLPNQFVLKTNHDSGGIIICKDKKSFNLDVAAKKLKKHLSRNYFYAWREWPYLNVKPLVIAESYLEDADSGELPDYKFFCFNGEPLIMFMATERNNEGETKFDFFDMEFNHLNLINGHPNSSFYLNKPDQFDEMIELSRTLSQGIPHVRVDFYQTKSGIYFGEMTFYHWSGMTPFEPDIWDQKMGSWIDLSCVKNSSDWNNRHEK